jgi:hypothetical protein
MLGRELRALYRPPQEMPQVLEALGRALADDDKSANSPESVARLDRQRSYDLPKRSGSHLLSPESIRKIRTLGRNSAPGVQSRRA